MWHLKLARAVSSSTTNHLIANHPRGTNLMQPCLPELQKPIPHASLEAINEKQLEVEKERERTRNLQ